MHLVVPPAPLARLAVGLLLRDLLSLRLTLPLLQLVLLPVVIKFCCRCCFGGCFCFPYCSSTAGAGRCGGCRLTGNEDVTGQVLARICGDCRMHADFMHMRIEVCMRGSSVASQRQQPHPAQRMVFGRWRMPPCGLTVAKPTSGW